MLIVGGRCESALAYASRVLVALVLVTSTSSAAAQDLEPRAYSNTPIGLNFLIAGYAYTSGGVAIDPALPLKNADVVMLLLVEVGMRVAQGISRDLEQAVKRLTQFQYEEDNATNRQRTNKEKYENRCVSRSDQPVAGERDREPEYDDHKERHRD